MNESASTFDHSSPEGLALDRAIRFVMVVLVFAADYLNILLASQIGMCRQIFRDMLGGKPLPALTSLIIDAGPLLLVFSLFIPLVAVGAAFIPRLSTALYIYGALILFAVMQTVTTWNFLTLPFITIIQQMQGG